MITTHIYAIVHVPSGDAYVGKSRQVANRLRSHRANLNRRHHSSPLLQALWEADGPSAFIFEILETLLGADRSGIKKAEIAWIARLGTLNALTIRDDLTGFTMRAASRAVISAKSKTWFASNSPECKAFLKTLHLNNTSDTKRENARASAFRRWADPADAAKLNAGLVKSRTDTALLAKRNAAIAAASSTPQAREVRSINSMAFWDNQQNRDAAAIRQKAAWNKERKATRSKQAKERIAALKESGEWFTSPEYLAIQRIIKSPEAIEKRNAGLATYHAKPEVKDAFVSRIKKTWADPVRRAEIVANQKASWTPERRAKKSAQMKTAAAEKRRKEPVTGF